MVTNVLELAAIADDLSGAAECAAHLGLRSSRSVLVLQQRGSDPVEALSEPVITVDTDSRAAGPADAAARATAASRTVGSAPVVVKKVDSLLRGHLAGETAAVQAALGRTPVVALAHPALGRTVVGGVVHVDGVPLHQTDLWHVEGRPAPASVLDALAGLDPALVPLDLVRRGVDAVAHELARLGAAGAAPVCDGATADDLGVVVAAAVLAFGDRLLVGAASVVASVAAGPRPSRADPSRDGREDGPGDSRRELVDSELGRARRMLVVIGTRAPGAAAQLDRLAEQADAVLVLSPERLLADPVSARAELEALLGGAAGPDGLTVLALDPRAPADPAAASALSRALADLAAPLLGRFDAAYLTGGATARAVLDLAGVTRLEVLGGLEPGTVLSRVPGGPLLLTRPGSFGDSHSLVRSAHLLLGRTHPRSTHV